MGDGAGLEAFLSNGRKVKGTIHRLSYESTLLPLGGGKHNLVVKKEIRTKIVKDAGDMV